MTIEEFDKKCVKRETIKQIENLLTHMSSAHNISVGAVCFHNKSVCPASVFVYEDKILVRRFKQLLLKRKRELIKEFEK